MNTPDQLKDLLEAKAGLYNRQSFIQDDPIFVPHQFTDKEDREVAAFLTATIAWGNRKSIVQSGMQLMMLMDYDPASFIRNFSSRDLSTFRGFVHRTFNEDDLDTFLFALKNIYLHHGGMERVFHEGATGRSAGSLSDLQGDRGNGGQACSIKAAIIHFRDVFFSIPHARRTQKHVSDPGKGSAAKRLNMMLRWLIRKDHAGVDFGIWNSFGPEHLYCPLDIHSGRVARGLGLLKRKQNDWKAVEELTAQLRKLDPGDPVKYDFALFGMGVFEKFR